MSDEEDENQEDSEQEENSEDTGEEIDQQEQQNQDVSFEKQVDDYCKSLEKTHGIEYANQVRKRYATAKEFKLFLDAEAFEGYWRKLMLDFLQKREKESERLNENMLQKLTDMDYRNFELHEKLMKSIEEDDRRSQELIDHLNRSIDEDDKAGSEIDRKISELVDLKLENEKRKKKALA
jgi:hypothetical protein